MQEWFVMRDDGTIVALGTASPCEGRPSTGTAASWGPVRITLASGRTATVVAHDALRGSHALIVVDPDDDPLADAERRFALSTREHEIATLVVAGLSRAAIARRLAIVEATVDHHLRSLYEKTGARGRAACVARLLGRDHAVS